MIISAITFEAAKREAIGHAIVGRDKFIRTVADWIDEYDRKHPPEEVPCDNSIMCLREGKRHRSTCPMNANYSESCPHYSWFSCADVHKTVN